MNNEKIDLHIEEKLDCEFSAKSEQSTCMETYPIGDYKVIVFTNKHNEFLFFSQDNNGKEIKIDQAIKKLENFFKMSMECSVIESEYFKVTNAKKMELSLNQLVEDLYLKKELLSRDNKFTRKYFKMMKVPKEMKYKSENFFNFSEFLTVDSFVKYNFHYFIRLSRDQLQTQSDILFLYDSSKKLSKEEKNILLNFAKGIAKQNHLLIWTDNILEYYYSKSNCLLEALNAEDFFKWYNIFCNEKNGRKEKLEYSKIIETNDKHTSERKRKKIN